MQDFVDHIKYLEFNSKGYGEPLNAFNHVVNLLFKRSL